MIEVDGFTFNGKVKLAWPIAGKIVALSKPQIEKKLLCGVTEYYTEYQKMPDPGQDEITHVILEVNAIEPDVIEVVGQFLAYNKGEATLKMLKEKPELAKKAKIYPNMYGVATKKLDGTPDIEKEAVCTIDILLDK